ncbi:MAG: VacB/RNase II family 3'-5' exoribonuclease [Sphingopyxis sp.]
MPRKDRPSTDLPTREAILDFIQKSREPAGKREIAKAFGLKSGEKIALKALLKDMADEGLIDGSKSAFHKMGGLPKVTVLRIQDADGSSVYAVPERWESDGPPPRVRVVERGKRSALGIGERILARIESAGNGHVAHPIRTLEAGAETVVGVLSADVTPSGKPQFWLRSVDKRNRKDWPVSDAGDAEVGELVLAEFCGRPPRQMVRVKERFGDVFAPRSFSKIAIHKYGLPHMFSAETLAEASLVAALPITPITPISAITDTQCQGFSHIPIFAIDPADARDHDDAIGAAPDDDPANKGGYKAIVAIADVSYYVRPASSLDREARRRGNSVYFPDSVVPMLPHILSSGVCSLIACEERAAIVCLMTIDRQGKVTSARFARVRVRLAANLAYEQAQAQIDAGEGAQFAALAPLWDCWRLLAKARDARSPLDLDLPERQVMLDEKGRISEIRIRERYDAHRVVEDYMIAANVAAARALEAKKSPVMYRVHDVPPREKLVALKEFLATYGVSFALGQVITPATFNRILERFEEPEARQRVMEQVLRTQTQAYYSPANAGHFGLALGSYGHFTSPIRRYADLLVHRALVAVYDLEVKRPNDKAVIATTALPREDGAAFARIGEIISDAERRAMEAERETIDRYVAAYLSEKVGEVMMTRITGVQSFGFFAQIEGLGGDGLVQASTLGDEYFRWDEANQALIGEHSGTRFTSGQKIELRLVDANPLTGGLAFTLPDADPDTARRVVGRGAPRGKGRHTAGRRGRPGNIRPR